MGVTGGGEGKPSKKKELSSRDHLKRSDGRRKHCGSQSIQGEARGVPAKETEFLRTQVKGRSFQSLTSLSRVRERRIESREGILRKEVAK